MIGASNWRFAKLATRSSTAWQVLLRPACATQSIQTAAKVHFVRYHSTVPINKYSGTGFVERPLKVLDSTAVERIKKELADVDVNSDGRYVNPVHLGSKKQVLNVTQMFSVFVLNHQTGRR
jgi:hypothetical protein